MATDVGELLTRKAGPMPMGVWLMLGAVGVFIAYRASQSEDVELARVVEEVPVPVGATAAFDQAPLVMSPVVRINVPEIDKLTEGVGSLTGALGANTGALGANTGALGANTGAAKAGAAATKAQTTATRANTSAVTGATSAANALARQIAAVPVPAPAAAPKAAPAARTYVIRSGDTLWAIAQRYSGSASRWPELYRANASVIDSVARSRGKAGGGHWIFPGTTLRIPW